MDLDLVWISAYTRRICPYIHAFQRDEEYSLFYHGNRNYLVTLQKQ